MKFLRGCDCERVGQDINYQGLSGKKYTLDFFLSAGMQLSTLTKVVHFTGKIAQLGLENTLFNH